LLTEELQADMVEPLLIFQVIARGRRKRAEGRRRKEEDDSRLF
jgi:hypothetical protein